MKQQNIEWDKGFIIWPFQKTPQNCTLFTPVYVKHCVGGWWYHQQGAASQLWDFHHHACHSNRRTKSPHQTSQTTTTTLSHPHKHTFQRFVHSHGRVYWHLRWCVLLFLSLTYISVFLVKQEHYNTKWEGTKVKNKRKHVNQQKLLQNIN